MIETCLQAVVQCMYVCVCVWLMNAVCGLQAVAQSMYHVCYVAHVWPLKLSVVRSKTQISLSRWQAHNFHVGKLFLGFIRRQTGYHHAPVTRLTHTHTETSMQWAVFATSSKHSCFIIRLCIQHIRHIFTDVLYKSTERPIDSIKHLSQSYTYIQIHTFTRSL